MYSKFLLLCVLLAHAFEFNGIFADGPVERFLKECFKMCDVYKAACIKKGTPPKVCAHNVAEMVAYCKSFGKTKEEILRKFECMQANRLCYKYGHDADACDQEYERCLKYQDKPTLAPGHTLSPHVGGCGKPDVQGLRVIAGKIAERGSWPWQGLLMFHGRPFCGATLISPQWAVTSAHCVYASDSTFWLSVKFGEQDRKTYQGSEVNVLVEKIIRHPKHDQKLITNDIALLKLKHPVVFNKFVSPVCLPSTQIPTGTNCYVTGWGYTHYPGQMSRFLQQGILQVVTNKKCYEKNKHLADIPISDDKMCGGSGGTDHQNGCHGDSGGPYVCEVNGVWELHGSISYGSPSCNSTEGYTVFSRIFHFLGWIKENIAIY